jgi:hypothetical protein
VVCALDYWIFPGFWLLFSLRVSLCGTPPIALGAERRISMATYSAKTLVALMALTAGWLGLDGVVGAATPAADRVELFAAVQAQQVELIDPCPSNSQRRLPAFPCWRRTSVVAETTEGTTITAAARRPIRVSEEALAAAWV